MLQSNFIHGSSACRVHGTRSSTDGVTAHSPGVRGRASRRVRRESRWSRARTARRIDRVPMSSARAFHPAVLLVVAAIVVGSACTSTPPVLRVTDDRGRLSTVRR